MNGDITFFLPLGAGSRWQNNELRFFLRSLSDNWVNDFNVIVYGDPDCKPDWLTNVTYKEIERYYPDGLELKYKGSRRFENFFCTLNKLKQFVNSEDCPSEFVYVYDDVILLRPQWNILNYPLTVLKYSKSKDRHIKTKNQAMRLLGTDAKWDMENHLPRLFKRDNLIRLFKEFDFTQMDVPYPVATMYFNHFKGECRNVPLDKSDGWYKVGFYMSDEHPCDVEATTLQKIENAVSKSTWMSYNDMGLNEPLKQWIIKTYPNKSKFEL
jgi:hypothetical protein